MADPAPPRSLDQVTWMTPTSSLAVPPIAIVVPEVECVAFVVGVVIVTTGDLPSAIEKSIAPAQGPSPAVLEARTDHDAGPAASAMRGLWRHTEPARGASGVGRREIDLDTRVSVAVVVDPQPVARGGGHGIPLEVGRCCRRRSGRTTQPRGHRRTGRDGPGERGGSSEGAVGNRSHDRERADPCGGTADGPARAGQRESGREPRRGKGERSPLGVRGGQGQRCRRTERARLVARVSQRRWLIRRRPTVAHTSGERSPSIGPGI